MDIIKIIGFSFTALFLYLILKDRKSELATIISLVSGVMIFAFVITKLNEIIYFIKDIANKANIDMVYIGIVVKILAIAYLATFCSEICKDAGASSIGSKVEFSAKILILSLAIPILMAVLQSILQIL
jgi:stage III sporulation protein AD